MQVQRFRRPTVREALADVRDTLGADALVLSTMMVPARGWRRLAGRREVEVTATLPVSLSENRPAAPATRRSGRGETPHGLRDEAEFATPMARRPAAITTPPGAEIVARLVAAGIDRALAAEVAAALPPASRRDPAQDLLAGCLAERLVPMTAADEPLAGIDVFVGPPGAGKTTTIAKLAAQLRARHGIRPTLVAADGYRVGAVEQLRLYADILRLPFVVARTAADLERMVTAAGRPMLVDTAGRSPADRGIRDLFDALSGRPRVRTHLVLAGGTTARDAARVLERYAAAAPTRVVLSKIDETESVSPLVTVLRGTALKVSYLGCGQRVPDDLRPGSAHHLAMAMLGEPLDGTAGTFERVEVQCA